MPYKKLFELGARLMECARLVRRGCVAADVGTDHALLPVWLIKNGVCRHVYATDIKPLPARKAEEQVARYGLEEQISVMCCDGLSGVPGDEIDDIIIAGMGGEVIAQILTRADFVRSERIRLILQPMSRLPELRRWLYTNGFCLLSESAVSDSSRCYSIMHCAYSGEKREPDEIEEFAGMLSAEDNPFAASLLRKQARILRDSQKGAQARGDTALAQKLSRIADELDSIAKGGHDY